MTEIKARAARMMVTNLVTCIPTAKMSCILCNLKKQIIVKPKNLISDSVKVEESQDNSVDDSAEQSYAHESDLRRTLDNQKMKFLKGMTEVLTTSPTLVLSW